MHIDSLVYLVTGASSGLGLATAQALLERGAYVAALDIREPPSGSFSPASSGSAFTNGAPESSSSERVYFVECDVGDDESVDRAVSAVKAKWEGRKWGGVVHCGGVGMVGKTVGNDGTPFSFDVFSETHRINLLGSFLIASKVAAVLASQYTASLDKTTRAPPQAEQDQGVIILTSSVSASEGQMGQVAYASSKAGVEGLVLPMARDLGRYGVRVMCLAPSLFSTAMGKNTNEKTRASLLATTLFPPRFGVPEEYAKLAVSVIENGYLNGGVIRIDGGGRMAKM
ncbi:hypothetical protein JCM10207_000504 [Rhodosporidiobolus poonsookiae]